MNNKLRIYVKNLVEEYKKSPYPNEWNLRVEELPFSEINNFVIMLLHVEPEYLSDTTLFYENEFKTALIKLFRKPDIDEKCAFSDIAMDILYKIYEKRMQELINEALND